MRRLIASLVLVVLGSVGATLGVHAEDDASLPPDAFEAALADLDMTVADLGYRPKATWSRYPHPKTVPYVLPFFEDLLAHPLDTYEFTRTLGNAVEDLLTPEALTALPDEKNRRETLSRLGVVLATERRIGGFRGYSVNLDPRPSESAPLVGALVTLLERSRDPIRRPMTFGGRWADKDDPQHRLSERVATIPEPLRRPLPVFHLLLSGLP